MKPKRKLTGKVLSEIERAFVEHKKGAVKEIAPDGWFTKHDYAVAKKVSEPTAERHIKALVRLNKIDIGSYSHLRLDGTYIKIPHYRMKQP